MENLSPIAHWFECAKCHRFSFLLVCIRIIRVVWCVWVRLCPYRIIHVYCSNEKRFTVLNKWLMNIRSCYARAHKQKAKFGINNAQISDVNVSLLFSPSLPLSFSPTSLSLHLSLSPSPPFVCFFVVVFRFFFFHLFRQIYCSPQCWAARKQIVLLFFFSTAFRRLSGDAVCI